MKTNNLLIFGWSIIAFLLLVFAVNEAFAEHLSSIDNYELHPSNMYYDDIHEIFVTEVWIQREHIYVPFEEPCAVGYEITEDGRCTIASLHYWIYPLYLVAEMPSGCSDRAIGCVLDKGIYIINGKQGALPQFGGCSVLYHEILHIKWGWMHDQTLQHQRMADEFPNERCAA